MLHEAVQIFFLKKIFLSGFVIRKSTLTNPPTDSDGSLIQIISGAGKIKPKAKIIRQETDGEKFNSNHPVFSIQIDHTLVRH